MNIETTYNEKYRDVGFVIGFSLVFGALGGSFGDAICEIVGVSTTYHWVPPLPLFAMLLALTVHEFAEDLKTKKRGRVATYVVLLLKLGAVAAGVVGSVFIWFRP